MGDGVTDGDSTDSGTVVLPLAEERVETGTRRVETGRVRVSTSVAERQELVEMLLERTDAGVERVPVGRPVDAVPPIRREGDTTVIPLVEEVLVVEKRLILREEIHIRTRTTTQRATETVTLRSDQATVERLEPGSGPPADIESSPTEKPFRERVVEIAEFREEPVVVKTARIREEVVI